MIGTRKNLIADAGTDFSVTFRIKNPDGSLADASGITAALALVKRGVETVLDTATADEDGWFALNVAHDADIDLGKHSYKIDLTYPDTSKARAFFGDLDWRGVE